MAVVTTYEFDTATIISSPYVFDNLAITGFMGGYLYAGEITSVYSDVYSGITLSHAEVDGQNVSLAGLSNNNFVVVSDTDNYIQFQIFTSGFVEVSSNITVGSVGSSTPDVAALANGGFVIAHQDLGGPMATYSNILLRFHNAIGSTQFVTNISGGNFIDLVDSDASVAVLDNGNVAVGWVRTDGAETEVWTAVYSATGVLVKAATLVDGTGTINDQVELAATPNGYVIVYRDNDFGPETVIGLRTFDSSGNAVGINATGSQFINSSNPSVARVSGGLLVVNWVTEFANSGYALIDGSNLTIYDTQAWENAANIHTGISEVTGFGSSQFALITQIVDPIANSQVSEGSVRRIITGDAAANTITAQNDMVHHLLGADGNDKLYGSALNDELDGGNGADILDGKGGVDIARGGAGNDSYLVDSVDDVIVEDVNGGTDKVTSTASYYQLAANVENLTLGSGAVTGFGNESANALTGNSADNTLFGGGGKDKLDGKAGADAMYGDDGDDTYFVDDAGDLVVETNSAVAGGKKDVVNISYDFANFTLGANVENGNLTGAGDQTINGNELANTLTSKGNGGNFHYMYGLGGKDTLKGGTGADQLSGGMGADTLTGGGAGLDIFLFDVAETSANKDTIKDFTVGVDEIGFSSAAFLGLAGASNSYLSDFAEMFALGTAATNEDQRLIYNQATGSLYYDADGDGAIGQVLVAVLSGQPVLDAGDIFVI